MLSGSDAKALTELKTTERYPLPSLYHLLPPPPEVNLFPSLFRTKKLVKQLESSPCVQVISDFADSYKPPRQQRASSQQSSKRRKRSATESVSSAGEGVTGREGDAEPTDAAASTSKKKRPPFKPVGLNAAEREAVTVSPRDVPRYFPDDNLLQAIHAEASISYYSKEVLLPTLTKSNPSHSDTTLQLMDTVEAECIRREEEATKAAEDAKATSDLKKYKPIVKKERELVQAGLARAKVEKWQETWLKPDQGTRRGVWVNVERAYDSSALIAIGMLLEIVAAEEAGDPTITFYGDDDSFESDSSRARSQDDDLPGVA